MNKLAFFIFGIVVGVVITFLLSNRYTPTEVSGISGRMDKLTGSVCIFGGSLMTESTYKYVGTEKCK
jgi:hypothetical protein